MKLKPILPAPFSKNTRPLHYIVVYGDTEERIVAKSLWAAIGSAEIKIQSADTLEMLRPLLADALLSFIYFQPGDDRFVMGMDIANDPNIVCGVIGVTDGVTEPDILTLMAGGYDSIFNIGNLAHEDFPFVIRNRLEKAKVRLADHRMHEEYRRLRTALKASPNAFVIFDQNRKLSFVSDHYLKAYPGVAHQMVRGLDVMEAFDLASEDMGMEKSDPQYPVMKKFWESLQGQVEFAMDDRRTWRIKASELPDGQGTIITTSDITDIVRTRLEIEDKSRLLQDALLKEQEASKLQKQFIGMVSHEFRTPLSIIDGHAQLIERQITENDEKAIIKRCKAIRNAVSRLVNMMESLLSSNILKTGRIDLDPETYDLRELIAELCGEQAELAPSHTISWDVSGLPPTVTNDRKMMVLILTNLLSNAVKFTGKNPKVDITTGREGDWITVSVMDNGVGIPADELDKIFDRYYRATTSSGIPGTGIGLSLVQDLVKMQKGQVRVISELGKGTTFTLLFRNLI